MDFWSSLVYTDLFLCVCMQNLWKKAEEKK